MWLDDTLDAILADAEERLTGCANCGDLCFVAKIPGDIPFDVFCEDGGCGQLTIRVLDVFPGDNFPNPSDPAQGNCYKPLTYQLELRAMRCFADTDEHGEGPTPEETAEASVQQNRDMLAMYEAIKCSTGDRKTAVLSYFPEGPQGNYVGGSWRFWVTQDD